MTMRTLLIILIATLAASALVARDVDMQVVSASESTAARLRAQVEPAFDHVEAMTGIRDEQGLTLVIAGGSRSFGEIARGDGVGMNAESVLGYAQPAVRRIVLNLGGIGERQLDPVGVLRHEIAHLVLGSAIAVERPLWFEEGVAQYVESVALNELREAAGANPFIDFESFADLNGALREEARAGAAYREARETVRLMVNRYGDGAFFRFMAALQDGEAGFDEAFAEEFGHDVQEFEAAWLEDRQRRAGSRWAGFMGGAFWWVLLGLTGALLPLIWMLLRVRGRSQLRKWEQQEGMEFEDPEWAYHDDGEGWRG